MRPETLTVFVLAICAAYFAYESAAIAQHFHQHQHDIRQRSPDPVALEATFVGNLKDSEGYRPSRSTPPLTKQIQPIQWSPPKSEYTNPLIRRARQSLGQCSTATINPASSGIYQCDTKFTVGGTTYGGFCICAVSKTP